MKKYMALLLAVILCLSMMACGGDAGAKDSVNQQTTANDMQQETVDSNTQGENEMVELPDDLIGTWKNDYYTLTLNKDGTGFIVTQDATIDNTIVRWDVWDDYINVYFDGYDAERGAGDFVFERWENGIMYLYSNLSDFSMPVPQAQTLLELVD